MAARGRHWLLVWLLFALAILAWVNARQTASVQLAGALREARARRGAAEAERAGLQRRVHEAESPGVLIPRAERLGLRLPVDSEIINLQGPAGRR